nr:unnamed protein product [Naegleria fowleri]
MNDRLFVIIFLLICFLGCNKCLGKTSSTSTPIYPSAPSLDAYHWNDKDEVWFAQSAALSGVSQRLGIEMKRGIEAAFQEINHLGGVWGSKKLRLLTLDDAYEPTYTKVNTDFFLFNTTPPAGSLNSAIFNQSVGGNEDIQKKVFFGLIGYVGTPTVQAVFPDVVSTGIPLIGSFTGVGWLRKPFYPNVINLRSSYDDETAAMVDWLINIKLIRRISILYQNDAFGLSGLNGIKRSLVDRLKIPLCSSGTFTRNTLNVENAFYSIGSCNPEAIVLVGTYAPLAKFIKLVKNIAFLNHTNDDNSNQTYGYRNADRIIFLTVSFVGSAALTEDLIKTPLPSLQFGSNYYTDNVIITQVVPSPMDTSFPIVRSYQRAISQYSNQIRSSYTFIELEGYMVGKFIYNVFKNMVGQNLTRSNFIASSYFDFTSDYADESKNGGLFVFDGIQFGRYKWCQSLNMYQYYLEKSQNNTFNNNTTNGICNSDCNQGLKIIYLSSINMNTGNISFDIFRSFSWYSSGSCISDVNSVLVKPIVIGQSIEIGSIQDELLRIGILVALHQRNDKNSKNQIVLKTLYHTNAETMRNNTRELMTLHEAVALVAYSSSLLIDQPSGNSSNSQSFVNVSEFSNIAMIGVSNINSLSLRTRFIKPLIHVFTSVLEQLGTLIDYNMKIGSSRCSIIYSQEDLISFEISQMFETITHSFGRSMDSKCNIDLYSNTSSNQQMDSLLNCLTSDDANPQVLMIALRNSSKLIESLLSSIQNTYNSKPMFRKGLRIYLINSLFEYHVEQELSLESIMKNENRFSLHYVSHIPSFTSNSKLFMNEFRMAIQNLPENIPHHTEDELFHQKVLEGYFIGRMVSTLIDTNSKTNSFSSLDLLNSIYSLGSFSSGNDVMFGMFREGSCNLGYRENFLYSFNSSSGRFEETFVKTFDSSKCALFDYQHTRNTQRSTLSTTTPSTTTTLTTTLTTTTLTIPSISLSEIQQPIIMVRLIPFEEELSEYDHILSLLSEVRNDELTESKDEYMKGLNYYFQLYNNKSSTKQYIRFHTEYYSTRDQGKYSILRKVKAMIEKQGVFAFIGTIFPESLDFYSNLTQLLAHYNVPMFTLSQSMQLRQLYSKYLIRLRPSILDETAAMIGYFKQVIGSPLAIVYPQREEWTRNVIPFISQYCEANELENVHQFSYQNSLQEYYSLSSLSSYPSIILFGNDTEIFNALQYLSSALSTTVGLSSVRFQIGILSSSYSPTLQQWLLNSWDKVNHNNIHVPTLTYGPSIENQCDSIPLSSIQQFMKTFLDSYKLSEPNHHTVEGYLTGYFIETLLGRIYQEKLTTKATRSDLLNTVFSNSIFNLMGLLDVGPFGLECSNKKDQPSSLLRDNRIPFSTLSTLNNLSECNVATTPTTVQKGDYCNCNQGPRKILLTQVSLRTSKSSSTLPSNNTGVSRVLTFKDVQNFEFSFSPSSCGVQIVYPLLTKGQIAGIAIGVILTLICSAAFCIFLYYRCGSRLSHVKYAPKSGPVAIGFTDVQNSTVLWEKNEKGMREALRIHNTVMRNALEAYRGYEVKTNGDSFYVAFSDVVDALDWSIAVQHALLDAEWPSSLTQLWDCRTEWDSETQQKVWNGLRVRIGLHFGTADRVFDKTMKRPDYFGTVVNTASRIESSAFGGQILISEDMFLELWKKLGTFIVKDVKFHSHNEQSYVEEIRNRCFVNDTWSDTTGGGAATAHMTPLHHRQSQEQSSSSATATLNVPPSPHPPPHRMVRQGSTCSNSSNTTLTVMTSTTTTAMNTFTTTTRKRYIARQRFLFIDLGEFRLKGLQQKVRLFDVRSERIQKRSFSLLLRNLEKEPSWSKEQFGNNHTGENQENAAEGGISGGGGGGENTFTPSSTPSNQHHHFNNRIVPVVASDGGEKDEYMKGTETTQILQSQSIDNKKPHP